MFFLIRCVFWLTVVFTTIFSQDPSKPPSQAQPAAQPAPPAAQVGALAQAWFSSAVSIAADQAVRRCEKAPADCVVMAKRLPDMVASQRLARSAAQTEQASPSAPIFADVPLPPRRPHAPASEKTATGLEKSPRAEYLKGHPGRG